MTRLTSTMLLAFGLFHPGAAAQAQTPGSAVGWGSQVILPPAQLRQVVQVASWQSHTLALRSDGSIVAWGNNGDGECLVPAPNRDFIAVETGSGHSIALKRDGSVVAWGANNWGQCNVPAPNSGFVAIS